MMRATLDDPRSRATSRKQGSPAARIKVVLRRLDAIGNATQHVRVNTWLLLYREWMLAVGESHGCCCIESHSVAGKRLLMHGDDKRITMYKNNCFAVGISGELWYNSRRARMLVSRHGRPGYVESVLFPNQKESCHKSTRVENSPRRKLTSSQTVGFPSGV